MKAYLFTLSLCLIFFNSLAQDTIELSNGEKLQVKIDTVGKHEIKYHRYNDPLNTSYVIKKAKVSKITFENGNIEYISLGEGFGGISKEETQKILIEKIDAFALERGNGNRNYLATFEDDYLKLQLEHINGGIYKENIIFDFSNVYEFQRISLRGEESAYINIFVSKLKNKKKNTWEKYKLVMLVRGHENAKTILNAFKHYHYLLLIEKER